jgi:hypothetical protein
LAKFSDGERSTVFLKAAKWETRRDKHKAVLKQAKGKGLVSGQNNRTVSPTLMRA